MKFNLFGWRFVISATRIPKAVRLVNTGKVTLKRAKKAGFGKCDVMDKVQYTEELAKLKAKQTRTANGSLRAYRCEFCPHWHLTHHKNKLLMH